MCADKREQLSITIPEAAGKLLEIDPLVLNESALTVFYLASTRFRLQFWVVTSYVLTSLNFILFDLGLILTIFIL